MRIAQARREAAAAARSPRGGPLFNSGRALFPRGKKRASRSMLPPLLLLLLLPAARLSGTAFPKRRSLLSLFLSFSCFAHSTPSFAACRRRLPIRRVFAAQPPPPRRPLRHLGLTEEIPADPGKTVRPTERPAGPNAAAASAAALSGLPPLLLRPTAATPRLFWGSPRNPYIPTPVTAGPEALASLFVPCILLFPFFACAARSRGRTTAAAALLAGRLRAGPFVALRQVSGNAAGPVCCSSSGRSRPGACAGRCSRRLRGPAVLSR